MPTDLPLKAQAQKLRKLAAALLAVADSLPGADSSDTLGTARFNRAGGTLLLRGKCVQLTRSETRILAALIDNRGVAVSREDLTQMLFGAECMTTRTIDNHVLNLRSKLGKAATILTVHGHGYKVT